MLELNAKTKELLEGCPTTDESADWIRLSAEDHPLSVMTALDSLRRWLEFPDLLRFKRPSAEFLGLLLGHGRDFALKVYEGFVTETARTGDEAKAVLGGLALVARQARGEGLIGWNIDTVKPGTAQKRILVALPDEVDARLREAAAARGESLTASPGRGCGSAGRSPIARSLGPRWRRVEIAQRRRSVTCSRAAFERSVLALSSAVSISLSDFDRWAGISLVSEDPRTCSRCAGISSVCEERRRSCSGDSGDPCRNVGGRVVSFVSVENVCAKRSEKKNRVPSTAYMLLTV